MICISGYLFPYDDFLKDVLFVSQITLQKVIPVSTPPSKSFNCRGLFFFLKCFFKCKCYLLTYCLESVQRWVTRLKQNFSGSSLYVKEFSAFTVLLEKISEFSTANNVYFQKICRLAFHLPSKLLWI